MSVISFQEGLKAAQIYFLIRSVPQEKFTDMVCTLLSFLSYVLEPSLIAKNILWDLKRKTVVA